MQLFQNYGYIVLTLSLILELIALPLPGQTIMTYCGYIIAQRNMNFPLAIIMASIGGISGITISYAIGRLLGKSILKKQNGILQHHNKNVDKVSFFFKKYGIIMLMVCYFIPGIRHVIGYFSGIIKIPFKRFVIFSYSGAFIWTTFFISVGKFIGKNFKIENILSTKDFVFLALLVVLIFILVFFLKKKYFKS